MPRILWCRGGRGNKARPSKAPSQPLVLWAYELSPFVKVVKETLCELELPYLQASPHLACASARLGGKGCVLR